MEGLSYPTVTTTAKMTKDDGYIESATSEHNYPIEVKLTIDGATTTFEGDTGASTSIAGPKEWIKLGKPRLQPSNNKPYGHGRSAIPVTGTGDVIVQYRDQRVPLKLIITDNEGSSHMGRDWLACFELDVNELLYDRNMLNVCQAESVTAANSNMLQVLDQTPVLFEPGLGHCNKTKAHLQLKDSAQPKFLNSRPIPFSRLDAVNEEMDRLINQGVIKKVDFSEWATPIVVVMKSNDKVRICGHYRLTVNPQLMVQHHQIPRVEELFARMNGCKIFSKLDLADAYLQIELDDASKQLLVINTPKGLYQYQRLPFGPSSAPGSRV